MKKVVLFSSFFETADYVGTRRLERFIRCLTRFQVDVAVVTAWHTTEVIEKPWGQLIRIGAGSRFCHEIPNCSGQARPQQRPTLISGLKRLLHRLLVYPDLSVVWALCAAAHPLVRKHCAGALCVLSSSPPESVHIGACILAGLIRSQFIMDMRDGWLDEPLKKSLRTAGLRRFIEGRMEARLIRKATGVLVSSNEWRRLLISRYPGIADKTSVLMSAADPTFPANVDTSRQTNLGLQLLHAGKLSESHVSRNLEFFREAFDCLLAAGNPSESSAELVFLGLRHQNDIDEITDLNDRLHNSHWRVSHLPPVPVAEARKMMTNASGLLLLNASPAAIPSKFFDYLSSGRPVLLITEPNTAMKHLAEECPQVFRFLLNSSDNGEGIRDFLVAAASSRTWPVPDQHTEDVHAELLAHVLGLSTGDRQ